MSEEGLLSPETRERALYGVLAALGIAWTTYAHRPVFTVEEAKKLRGELPGGHTKNLFLKDRKNALWLVVLREELSVDLNALAKLLGVARFSFASSEVLKATLGVPPGSVTPFALINDQGARVRVVLDEGMLTREPLNFHPLRNDRTTAIGAEDLHKFLRGCQHEPVVTALPERK